MEERHKIALKKVRQQLLDDLEVTPILDHLISDGIITQFNCEQVRAEKTRHEQVGCLLDILPLKGPKAFNAFYQCIPQYQEHLQEVLLKAVEGLSTGEVTTPQHTHHTKAPSLSNRHQIVLRQMRDDLVTELESEPVLTGLLANLKISQEEYNKIKSQRSREEQVKSLLDLLPRKDQTTFDEFSKLLQDNQDWLHEKLTTQLENITEDDLATFEGESSLELSRGDYRTAPEVQKDGTEMSHLMGGAAQSDHTTQQTRLTSEKSIIAKEKPMQVASGTLQTTGMSIRCQLALQKSRQELVKDLDVKPVTDCLLAKLIITHEDCQTILAKHSDYNKRRLLLDLLPQRGQRAFDELSEFLAKPANQTWLHRTLCENWDSITQGEIVEVEKGQRGIGGDVIVKVSMKIDAPAGASWSHIFRGRKITDEAFEKFRSVLEQFGAILIDVKRGSLDLLLGFIAYPLLDAFYTAHREGRLQDELSLALVGLGCIAVRQLVRITLPPREQALHRVYAGERTSATASGTTDAINMTSRHKQIIIDHFEELVEHLTVGSIINCLVAKRIIHPDELDEIQTSATKDVGRLLSLIMKREDRAFYVLRDACAAKCMPHLANLLTD